ncbi:MAG: complex I NDUFA9 subunit family protein [Pseudomonadota bacterium]
MPSSDHSKLITIFGGSGFIGRYVVRALAKDGHRIRVAVRKPELAGHLQPVGDVGQIHAVGANLRHQASVERAIEGADIVINLVGILYQSGKQTFQDIHAQGAARVARIAKNAGAKQLIHMSAIGADLRSKSVYAHTKANAEQAVLSAFPNAIILRPSIVFGPEDGFFNMFASLATFAPALPLIGGGKTRMQPVYVGDVAEAVRNCCNRQGQQGTIYELGGPDIYTFKQLMQKTLEFSERSALLVPVPFFFAKLKALFLGLLPKPLLTLDQVRLLQYDNVVSRHAIWEGRTLEKLGVRSLQSIDAIVPSYLEQYRPKGQYSRYKSGILA